MNSSSETTPVAKRPWLRSLLLNLFVSCCSFLLIFGAVEGFLRWRGYGNVEIYSADPLLYWRLKPNQDCYTKVDHKPVHINSQGTRGPEFQTAKPADTLRIVSLGDSRTFGWGLTEAETYSGRLQQRLQEHFGSKRRVEVINAGVNAWSFAQMATYFRACALALQPDYVIVGDANLWTQFSEHNSPEFVRKFMWRVRLKNLLRRSAIYHYVVEVKLHDVYERYRVKFVPVDPKTDTLFKEQQQKDPESVFRGALESLCSVAISNRVVPVLMYLPTADESTRPLQKNLRETKQKISEKLHVPFLDLSADVTGTGTNLYLEADPVHFNAEGNRIISDRLLQTFTNLFTHEQVRDH